MARRVGNLAGTTLPLVGLAVAIVLLWNRMVCVRELAILFVDYLVAGLGITVGYHRLFTHRSFQTFRVVRYAFAILGQLAVEGTVLSWVANHRKHHQFADRSGDPHSPHADRGEGFVEGLKGLWHANRHAKDLIADRGLRVIAWLFVPMVVLSLVIPGRRRFAVRDESRNVWWLSWLSFGESWHNNHHAFPDSAFHGLRPGEIDPGGLVIRRSNASVWPGTSCGLRRGGRRSSGSTACSLGMGCFVSAAD